MNPQADPTPTSTFHAAHGVAGVIIGSLVVVFLLHFLGFRFVVAVGGSVGVG